MVPDDSTWTFDSYIVDLTTIDPELRLSHPRPDQDPVRTTELGTLSELVLRHLDRSVTSDDAITTVDLCLPTRTTDTNTHTWTQVLGTHRRSSDLSTYGRTTSPGVSDRTVAQPGPRTPISSVGSRTSVTQTTT